MTLSGVFDLFKLWVPGISGGSNGTCFGKSLGGSDELMHMRHVATSLPSQLFAGCPPHGGLWHRMQGGTGASLSLAALSGALTSPGWSSLEGVHSATLSDLTLPCRKGPCGLSESPLVTALLTQTG